MNYYQFYSDDTCTDNYHLFWNFLQREGASRWNNCIFVNLIKENDIIRRRKMNKILQSYPENDSSETYVHRKMSPKWQKKRTHFNSRERCHFRSSGDQDVFCGYLLFTSIIFLDSYFVDTRDTSKSLDVSDLTRNIKLLICTWNMVASIHSLAEDAISATSVVLANEEYVDFVDQIVEVTRPFDDGHCGLVGSAPLGTEQAANSIPGSVGYISHVHWTTRLLYYLVPSGFSGYIWLDTKIVLKKCIDIWDWNLGDEESKSAKSGEDGTDDGEMDVRGVAEG